MDHIGYTTAFAAGLASFLSPCVLPLVPAYLSFISGVSIEELTAKGSGTAGKVLWHSFFFVAGFSAVFVAMGAAATAVGEFLLVNRRLLRIIAGVLIVLFGLGLMGVLRLRFLMAEKRYHGRVGRGPAGAALLGMAFAFGWTPCVGPILFSILAYAGTRETVWQGVALLSFYSAGIGVPFLLIGLGTGTFIRLLDRFRKYLRLVELASGALMVAFGLLVLFGWLEKLTPSIR